MSGRAGPERRWTLTFDIDKLLGRERADLFVRAPLLVFLGGAAVAALLTLVAVLGGSR